MIWLREGLYRLTLDQLQAVGTPSSLAEAADALARVRDATPQIGSTAVELVYYPITPCRFIDTRNVGGKIPNNGSRAYDLDVTGDVYGGSAACNPKAAVGNDANNMAAISMNVAIVDPSFAPGFLGARPFTSTNTTSLVNWYEAGPTVQASNAGVSTDLRLTVDYLTAYFA